MTRPPVGALVEALARSSAARASPGVSTRSPRIRRSADDHSVTLEQTVVEVCGSADHNVPKLASRLSLG